MIVPQKSAQRIAASHWLVVVRFVDPTQQQQVVSYLSDFALYDSAQYSPSSSAAAWRKANAGRVSLEQLKVMSAIESCRTATLGGHVARWQNCAHYPSPTVAPRAGAQTAARRRRECRP